MQTVDDLLAEIEKVAFEIPPANIYTPRLIGAVQALRRILREKAVDQQVEDYVEEPRPSVWAVGPLYGYCPGCHAPGLARDRTPDGEDTCGNGHVYPSNTALKEIP